MNSWPSLAIPPLDTKFQLPALRVAATQGLTTLEGHEKFTLYVCGITPYDATHLGHAATYLTYDLIHRYLLAQGRSVTFVENITDIDDPLLERANRDGVDWEELARSQIDLFRSDMSALHILPPESFVPVTEAMPLIIECVNRLMENGFAYKIEEDIYFDISAFKSRLPLSEVEALKIFAERGGDPLRKGKRNPLDALLWLGKRAGEPSWSAPFGDGRPGWHIECSAIALRYLLGEEFLNAKSGMTISFQGGGSDLIFPHHFMSGIQAEALTGQVFAKTYLHTGMMGLDGEKMSKSKGNLVFVSRLLASGVDAMVIRHALLSSKYSSDRMWSDDVLQKSAAAVRRLQLALAQQSLSGVDQLIERLIASLVDDLDTPTALQELDDWAADQLQSGNSGPDSPGVLSRFLDTLLGLAL
jgi:L-cysteine:1D-myo-inositol 2-amino-2-deoxy-alpha-D-glucopyranoside ligase